ncbi:MAG: NAD-dependent epimerase/dehydratase family protein [Planctomycetota bacterium]
MTGATGFLGRQLVRSLLRAGIPPERLRCLCRDPAAAVALGLPPAAVVAGSLGDPGALRRAAAGATVVFHLAGAVKAARRREFFATNGAGTEDLVTAVEESAPGAFFVLVSSLAAAGPSTDGAGSDAPPAQCRPVSAYGASKLAGERAVVAGARRWAIVRPPVVYGPGDAATRLLCRQALAPVCAVPPRARPLSVVHVRDVARALLCVAEREPHGGVFAIDGPARTDTHALLRAFAAACGRRARLVPVPLGLAAVAASVCDVWAATTGRAGFFNGDKVRELRAPGWVADGAALAALGFRPEVDLEAGLRELARGEGLRRGGPNVEDADAGGAGDDGPGNAGADDPT